MAKKNKIVFQHTYRKGVTIDKKSVTEDVKNSSSIEVLKGGKYEDGAEFIVLRINVK